jgi:transcriptional regulator with XRE-family HTH domain
LAAASLWRIEDRMTAVGALDRRIGERIRQRRIELGLTQHDLAAALDCSYQQIQKFENGANRIAATQLHALGHRLAVPVGWFFDEDAGTAVAAATLEEHGGRQRAAIDLARGFAQIDSHEVKLAVAALVRAVVKQQGG